MNMKRILSLAFFLVGQSASLALVVPSHHGQRTVATSVTKLFMSSQMPDPERLREIMKEEATNPDNVKAAAQMMKNLSPQDIDNMLKEMDNMPAAQRQQMEAMGMNVDIMRQSIEMMKSNPEMTKQMAKMMESMTPEEIIEKSRQAQANFGGGVMPPMTSPAAAVASTPAAVIDTKVESKVKDDDDEDDDDDDQAESEPVPPPPEAEVLDTLYRTAELMSSPPTGKVTLAGFATIPPVALLVGDDVERDLSRKELNECWADGSLGSTRVDRSGFERVWMEVQEYFSVPIMEKARERSVEKRATKRGGDTPKPVSPPSPVSVVPNSPPKVGEAMSTEQLEQVKKMSDSDMDLMLEQMNNLTPEQAARMKAMGVDPAMMQKTASLLKSNPLMKNAAKMMMKNMSPEQMKKASQQAQQQMSNMTPEDMQKMIDDLEKKNK